MLLVKKMIKRQGVKPLEGRGLALIQSLMRLKQQKWYINIYFIALNDSVRDHFSRLISLTQVKIAETLCEVHKVPTHQIAVLTPYSAQKLLIDKMMKEANLTIKVASITESQGEY